MLSMHLKEANRRKQAMAERFESQSRELRKTAEELSDAMLTAINEQVSIAYYSEREIENQLRAIQRQIASHSSNTEQWVNVIQRLNTELKEMGDVANWVQVLEEAMVDIRDVAKKLKK